MRSTLEKLKPNTNVTATSLGAAFSTIIIYYFNVPVEVAAAIVTVVVYILSSIVPVPYLDKVHNEDLDGD
jgi:Mg2+/Co2+ transporter CorB